MVVAPFEAFEHASHAANAVKVLHSEISRPNHGPVYQVDLCGNTAVDQRCMHSSLLSHRLTAHRPRSAPSNYLVNRNQAPKELAPMVQALSGGFEIT